MFKKFNFACIYYSELNPLCLFWVSMTYMPYGIGWIFINFPDFITTFTIEKKHSIHENFKNFIDEIYIQILKLQKFSMCTTILVKKIP